MGIQTIVRSGRKIQSCVSTVKNSKSVRANKLSQRIPSSILAGVTCCSEIQQTDYLYIGCNPYPYCLTVFQSHTTNHPKPEPHTGLRQISRGQINKQKIYRAVAFMRCDCSPKSFTEEVYMLDLLTNDLLWVVEGGIVCGIAMLIMYVICKAVGKLFD
jgi:hypothetical protein